MRNGKVYTIGMWLLCGVIAVSIAMAAYFRFSVVQNASAAVYAAAEPESKAVAIQNENPDSLEETATDPAPEELPDDAAPEEETTPNGWKKPKEVTGLTHTQIGQLEDLMREIAKESRD